MAAPGDGGPVADRSGASTPMRGGSGRGVLALVLLGSLLLAIACGSPRRSEPIRGPLPDLDEAAALGEQVFGRYCQECHPGGEAGLGPSINDKPLPAFLIRFQVRRGMGAMPGFSSEQISDHELDALVRYLQVLRRHEGS